jgi:ribosome biogenesis GTPase
LPDLSGNDLQPARITAVDRDSYQLNNGQSEVRAELSGRFRYNIDSEYDLPAVGDWVIARFVDPFSLAIIESMLPRKTVLRRKVAGKQIAFQVIAANVDTALILLSCDSDLSINRLERYMVAITEGGIRPVVILSKTDLVSQVELEERMSMIQKAGPRTDVLGCSITTGSGLEHLSRYLAPFKTTCLIGPSGVGKTSLTNYLAGRHISPTREVRFSDAKGRHTTTRRQLIFLPGSAMLIDTPGLREMGNMYVESGIESVFSTIERYASRCLFNDCSHTGEKGCAVEEALANGLLERERYDHYLKLKKESDYYRLSYLEKRKKDRRLGKLYRSVMKNKYKHQ